MNKLKNSKSKKVATPTPCATNHQETQLCISRTNSAKSFAKEALLIVVCIALALLSLFPQKAYTETRTSENYKIFADTLGDGGDYSTSTNYRLWDTVGEIASDENSTSTNFRARIGFQALIPDDILNVTFSQQTIDLGALSQSSVSQGTLTVTYSTNANGFTSTISEDGNLRVSGADIDDVVDGEVSAGTEEYGFRTSGSMGQQNSADTSITASQKTIASRTDPTPSASIGVVFKASISAQTQQGSYSHVATITTTGNF